MSVIFAGLAFIWWGILGFLGVCLFFWWVFQSAADRVPRDQQDVARRAGWLRFWFGEEGGKLWLANEEARKVSCHGCAKRVLGGYEGIVVDPTRSYDDYVYRRPWGWDFFGKYIDGQGDTPRGCDWLAAGFWEPFVRRGVRIDPVAMVREEMIRGFQRKDGPPLFSPFDDGGKLCRETRVEAMEIEAAGGHRAMGIGNGGARRTYWKGSKERMAQWIETGKKEVAT